MRNIKDYTEKYAGEPFEATMVEIRKKKVMAQCNKYSHENILEIGCGMNPYFLDFKDYRNMVIVEPGGYLLKMPGSWEKKKEKTFQLFPDF